MHCTDPDTMASSASRISCLYCSKTFSFRSGLSRHIRQNHSDEERSSDHLGCHLCESRLDNNYLSTVIDCVQVSYHKKFDNSPSK